MSYWKYCLHLGCLLLLGSSLRAAEFQTAAWQDAYNAELRCDAVAEHNALVRLRGYQRVGLLTLTPEQRQRIDLEVSGFVVVLPVAPSPPIAPVVAQAIPLESTEPTRRKRKTNSRGIRSRRAVINKDALAADLLKKAETAYRFGRLEESQRFFELVLKVKPDSEAAQKGLEKIAAELK